MRKFNIMDLIFDIYACTHESGNPNEISDYFRKLKRGSLLYILLHFTFIHSKYKMAKINNIFLLTDGSILNRFFGGLPLKL